MDETRQTLPKEARLRHRAEFLRVQRGGRSAGEPSLLVVVLENGLLHRRLGVTVSSRIGNAVERTRVKRWLREIFRKQRSALPEGVDVVLIARKGSPQAGLHRLEQAFLRAARRLRAQQQER